MNIGSIPKVETIEGALRTLCAWICQLIYPLIAKIFQLFIDISQIMVLQHEQYKTIYSRVTVFLTIIMVFYVTFEFIKYLVQPDTLTDKEKGVSNIGRKIIIVVVLIAFVPDIFDYSWKFQNFIIKSDYIPKIILGKGFINNGNNEEMVKIGNQFSAVMFSNFYRYDGAWNDEDGINECEKGISCKRIVDSNLSGLATEGEFSNLTLGINAAKQNPSGDTNIALISFNGLFAVLVGGFILYILALYTIDVAKRIFQITYLQIIAPIPIIGYLSPKKDNIFSKWLKQCIATYADLFIRLSIMYFILLLSTMIGNAMNEGDFLNNVSSLNSDKSLIYIVLILGLLLFAQKAPKLIEELLPKSLTAAGGNFGLKAGERVAPLAARALGAAWGGTKIAGALARRAAYAHARNKANGRHSIFTKEGQEERRQDREHRREMRRANRLSTNAQADKKSFEELSTAQAGMARRNEDFKNKFKGDIASLRSRKAAIDGMAEGEAKERAKREYERDRMALSQRMQNERQKMMNTKEGQRLTSAIGRVQSSETMRAIRSDRSDTTRRIENAEAEKRRLTTNRALARTDADRKKIDDAILAQDKIIASERKRLDTIKKDEIQLKNAASRDQRLNELAQRQQRTSEQVLKDQNEHYQGAASVITSAVGGTLKTMAQGAKSTKLEDIGKNVQQGVKNDIADVKATQKYYDEGGTGWVDRTVQQVEKKIGMPTAYERTMLESRTMEPAIKKYGAQATLADNFTSTVDAADDRSKSKIRESKIAAEVKSDGNTYIKTGFKDAAGKDEYVKLQAGESTLADVVKRYDQMEADAHTHSANEQKRYDDFVADNREALTDAQIMSKERSSLSAADQARYDAINADMARKANAEKASQEEARLRQARDDASQEEIRARAAKTQVEKNAARQNEVAVLKAFNDPTIARLDSPEAKLAAVKAQNFDGALVEQMWDALERMRLLRQDPDMVDAMRNVFTDGDGHVQPEFEKFMSGDIVSADPNETWDTYDKINNAAKSASKSKKRAKAQIEEQQRALQTSNATAAQKAANDYSGSGK